jgi:secreted PhoX family phosphatase
VNVDPNDSTSPKVARQPNSFVYRFTPYNPADLSAGGKLQALRVSINGTPVVFGSNASADVFSDAQLALHTPGTSYPVDWVTIHDTAVDGFASFGANALAKSKGATPFKRPENAQFLPGSGFRTFFFDPTADTDAQAGTPALAARGSWGSIFRVDLTAADRNSGIISIFVLGDADHASFDNLTFSDDHTLLAAEDRGDTLHAQLNKLDSVWAYATDGSAPARRFVALGRDPLAVGVEDNEPTGLHVSTGGTSVADLPGTLNNLVSPRAFLTRQHGQNQLWEIVSTR